MIRRRPLLAASLLPLLARPGPGRAAETWPSRPVRVVVPYPPGGSADVLARAVLPALGERLGGASFVVDNRPGGAAVVGTLAVAHAAPDGETLCLSTNQTHAANAAMMRNLPYRPLEDFAPVGRVATVHHAFVVPASGPDRSLADLAARGRQARLSYASSGVGSASHVIAEGFVRQREVQATHVPYRGGAQAATDTVAGVVDFFVSTWPQVAELVRDNKLRCLAVGAPARLPALPAVPTFAEAGAGDLAVDAWFGLWAPARTPDAIVARLGEALGAALREPELAARLDGAGFLAAPLAPADFAAFQKAEVARWGALVRLTGITLDN